METIITIASYALAFGIGVYAGVDYTNRHYEEYATYLEEKRGELLSYRDELIDISEKLENKDKHIRHKWQEMVTDFSKYQSMVEGFESGLWTDMDDIYLNSWKSAEE
ncbi:MAG: hypothetical protein J5965_10140 [Aeriscardovia sp.]|nr:hypothetical protein [Aeriscardovia sp.]